LQGEVSSLSATIDKLKEKIDELERNLTTAREEKAMEEDKSRHLAKLHAEQAHQHAALITEEQKQHDKELAEERERVRRVEERLLESQEANAALINEVQEVHGEMKEMQESREAAQQLATITAVKDAFALQIEVQKKENETLTSQVDQLQREYVFPLSIYHQLVLEHSLTIAWRFARCNQSGCSSLWRWR
jgi:chromosome segregation ATPase